jgi:hypothetical protein
MIASAAIWSLVRKVDAGLRRQIRHVLVADVEQPQQRQADGAVTDVMDDPAEGDPTVAEEELRAGRPGCGIVMDARPLDLRAVAFRRRVIDGEDQPPAIVDLFQDDLQEPGGNLLRLASDDIEEVIIGLEVRADPHGSPPTRYGAPSRGDEDPGDDDGQPPAMVSPTAGSSPSSKRGARRRIRFQLQAGWPERGRFNTNTPISATRSAEGSTTRPAA